MKIKLTMKELTKANAINNGLDVSEIGNTLQWTMANGKTCIQYFDTDGNWIKSEWV